MVAIITESGVATGSYDRVDKGTPTERLMWVAPSRMRSDLLKLSHNDPSSGHMGVNRCVERLQQQYYWPGMASEMQLWIAECEMCDRHKSPVSPRKSPMKSIEVGHPIELWAMDILGPLPLTSRGNQYIFVMSDYFTKWVEAVPLAYQRADTVAKAFVDEVVTRLGVPRKILADHGRNFEAELMRQTEAKEQFISNYFDAFEKSLKDVQRLVKEMISEAQKKQKKGYDYRNNIDKSTLFK
ncbi:Retrovirus-related Pol poly from transposon, partial [Paramuricea clavata]